MGGGSGTHVGDRLKEPNVEGEGGRVRLLGFRCRQLYIVSNGEVYEGGVVNTEQEAE